ncbi:hypothetical protein LCGC14_2866560, partial [marine sediment metagenome]
MSEQKKWEQFKKPPKEELERRLDPVQYSITQGDGTEPAYNNDYWNNNREGIYVDIVSGEPLFSSTDKYDSKTGWPSFTKPLSDDRISAKKETGLFARTE